MNLAALVGGRDEVLKPVFDPFHRTVEPHRDPGQCDLFRVEHHDLGAETATDKGRDDAHLPLAQAQHRGKPVADEDRRLGGIPDRHLAAARVPLGDHAARLDRRGYAVLIVKTALEYEISLCHSAAIIPLDLADMRGDVRSQVVVNMHRQHAETMFEINHRRQAFELYFDIIERVLGDVAVFRDHDCERLADVADLVLCQRHLRSLVKDDPRDRRRRNQQRAGLPVGAEIVRCIDRHDARMLQRPGDVDTLDPRMGNLAAQECRVQHAGQFEVIDEQRLPGQELFVFVAFDRCAEEASGHGAPARIACAAAIMASTMF